MEKPPIFPTSPQDAALKTAKQILELRDSTFLPKEMRGHLIFQIALFSCIVGVISYLIRNNFLEGFITGLLLNALILGFSYMAHKFNHAHALRPEYDWVEEYRE